MKLLRNWILRLVPDRVLDQATLGGLWLYGFHIGNNIDVAAERCKREVKVLR